MARRHLHLLGENACALGRAAVVGVTADPEPPPVASAPHPPAAGTPMAAAPVGEPPELVEVLG